MKYILMFKIIIHVFKGFYCILIKIILMFKILILVFQMDINCILMKYYFNVYDHNSCFSKGFYLHFNEYYFNV